MRSARKLSLIAVADASGWNSSVEKARSLRGDDGQFFTPSGIADALASWFDDRGLDRREVHVLDPGAGGGVLSAAFVQRICNSRAAGGLTRVKQITLEAWELDEAFLPTLRENLAASVEALGRSGIRAILEIHHGCYLEGGANAIDSGLFGHSQPPRVTHAILNPPYRKISVKSRERAILGSAGLDVSNLYGGFVWLALQQLIDGGELVAITPRSFCNGPYFREFRRALLKDASFRRVHVFESRSEAFGRDAVLQENILFHLARGGDSEKILTIATGTLESPVEAAMSRERFVSPDDPDQIIHVATESDAAEVRAYFDGLPCRLAGLGVEVSTGPVVDFRLKEHLYDRLDSGLVPLVYPHCVKNGQVIAPLARAEAYPETRVRKKPVAIRNTDETRKWLLSCARFVLIKRFTSKEERRRLIAGVLDPETFRSEFVGIENHLNFFHWKRGGLEAALARGLCRFLNSTVADRYFRQFNGHTQVNVSDLRALRYPDRKTLERLGNLDLEDKDQRALDLAMREFTGAPLLVE